MRVALRSLAAVAALVVAGPSASAEADMSIRGFHAYDAGSHLTFKWTLCTDRAQRAQTIVYFARVGSRQWRQRYDSPRYRRGCSPWVMTERDTYLNGTWVAYVQVGLNPPQAVSKNYAFLIG